MMIKKIILSAALFVGVHAYAQLNKGKIMINGNGMYYLYQSDEKKDDRPSGAKTKSLSAYAHVNIGYFISNRFALGIEGGLVRSQFNSTMNYENGTTSFNKDAGRNFSGGVFARYNHLFGEHKLGLFMQLDNRCEWWVSETEYTYIPAGGPREVSHTKTTGRSYIAALTPGVLYFVNKRLSLELSFGNLSYRSDINKDDPSETHVTEGSEFNMNVSFSSLNLGLTFYIGKGKNGTNGNDSKTPDN